MLGSDGITAYVELLTLLHKLKLEYQYDLEYLESLPPYELEMIIIIINNWVSSKDDSEQL